MASGVQIWSGTQPNKLLVDITGRMLNLVGSFQIPLYIYYTNGWEAVHEIPQQVISGVYQLPKTFKGDIIYIPSFDDPNFKSIIRGPLATRFNLKYDSGERIYVPPDCSYNNGTVGWSYDLRRIMPSADYDCVVIGGFTINVGFY